MARHDQRDYRGRFRLADTTNAPQSAAGKFDTMQELDVTTQPEGYAYELVGRDESSAGPRYAAPWMADNFGVTGARLRSRNSVMVHPDELAADDYGVHNEVIRSAARNSGPLDPSGYLTGLPARQATSKEASDGER